jgi:anti-sigma-K factor RskA
MTTEPKTKLDHLIADKIAAGLSPDHAREAVARQLAHDDKIAAARKRLKADKADLRS